jgi:hypothetical protein
MNANWYKNPITFENDAFPFDDIAIENDAFTFYVLRFWARSIYDNA